LDEAQRNEFFSTVEGLLEIADSPKDVAEQAVGAQSLTWSKLGQRTKPDVGRTSS